MSDGESTERVEALEQQVAELEATVRGLTEELVDRTERIRQLEDQHDLTADGSEAETTPEPDGDDDKGTETEGGDESDSESGDDIIVA